MPDSPFTLDRLQRLENWVIAVYHREAEIMAIGQEILDAVKAETTSVDSVIALIQGLAANGTISADVQAAILSEIATAKSKLDAAIAANTPPVPPTP